MIVDISQQASYVQWVASLLETSAEYFQNASTIALTEDCEPITVVVYSRFDGFNCEISVASKGKQWLRPKYIRMILKYPFKQLKCSRVSLLVKSSNFKTINLCMRLGFMMEGRLRQFFGTEDCIIFGLTRQEYEKLYGKEIRPADACTA